MFQFKYRIDSETSWTSKLLVPKLYKLFYNLLLQNFKLQVTGRNKFSRVDGTSLVIKRVTRNLVMKCLKNCKLINCII